MPAAVAEAARVLTAGGLVAFPTETVYGLGADATDGRAVARLYAAKGRPAFNPLIAHVVDLKAAQALARFNPKAAKLAKAFWPGPLTLVLPRTARCRVADLATAGLDTIAVRIPNHGVARDILAAFGKPVVAPSANRSGHVSPTRAEHVQADLAGRIELIIDGDAAPVGVEFDDHRLPRRAGPAAAGGLPRAAIEGVLEQKLAYAPPGSPRAEDAPLAPGMLAAHYAPRTRLRLDVGRVEAGEALLAFGRRPAEGAERRAEGAQPVGAGRPYRGGRQSVFAPAGA